MVCRLSLIGEQVKFSFWHFTVEPIIFLVYLGWVFGNTFQSPGLYRRICEIYYGDDNSVNCYQIANHDIEDIVQQHSAEWTLFSVVAYLIPALFSDTILGAYGDRYGRKLNILLGLAGIALSEYGYLLTLSSAATPYWTTLIFGAVSGMTGYIAMIPVSCNAYLADTTEDTDLLTIKSGIFSAFQTFGSVAGGFLAAGFADYIRIPAAIDFELLLFLIAFLYTLWRIPQKPGLQEIDRRAQVQAVRAVTYSNNDRKSSVQNMKNFFNELMNLLKSGFITYTKKRPGHRRAFIFIAVLVLMLNYTTSVETRTSGLINSFVFRRTDEGSLAWTTEELGYWNGSGYLMLLFGTLSGLLLFKKVLKLRETTIILIGLLSSTIRTIIIGYSSNDWMMYLANAVGLFAGLIQPAVVSFLTQLVPASEIGRTFSLFGIGGDTAFIITTVVYANIYRVTVPWSPGFLFYTIAGMQSIAFIAMLWVHFKTRSEGIGKATVEPKPANVQRAISRIGEEASVETGTSDLSMKNSKYKMGKRQISIIEHAEDLANHQTEVALWESMEDLRSQRHGNVRFY